MSATIEPYNPAWPSHFEQIRKTLDAQLHYIEGVSYEHIGSTAVPFLFARPVIDILITAPGSHSGADIQTQTPSQVDRVCKELASCGKYDKASHLDTELGFSLSARDESPHPHTVFICARESHWTRVHLAVRGTLRSDTELRDEYATTKTRALETAKEQYAKEACLVNEQYLSTYTQKKNALLQEVIIASQHFASHELTLLFASHPTARWDSISTQRLLLREFDMSDIDGMFALESNDENARYQDWHPWTHLQARQAVMRGIQGSYGKGRMVVELAVVYEGAFVGRIGARMRVRQPPPPPEPPANGLTDGAEDEIGARRVAEHIDLWFSFLSSSQGRGLATEAMHAFIAALVRKEKIENAPLELEIECDPRNTGSWKMAERLNFEKVSLMERAWESKGEWVDSLVYQKMV